MNDLIIYDTEATDLDVKHGQITQFAAVKADINFNISDQLNIRVRRLPWVVPTPRALEVTGMDVHDLDSKGDMSEYDASEKIEKFVVPGYGDKRLLVTFNGRFDDELIRTTLFRNLRSPWFSSGKKTYKLDVLDLIRLACSDESVDINVPIKDDGTPSWKLEHLSPANGIEINAHDALGDTLSTMRLAKLVKEKAPWAWRVAVWCGLAENCEKKMKEALAADKPVFLHKHFGKPEIMPVAVLGTDSKKKWVLADLRKMDAMPDSAEEIASLLYTPNTPFPVIRTNNAPYFLGEDLATTLDPTINIADIRLRVQEIKEKGLSTAAVRALKSRPYDQSNETTSEEKIYSGFVDDWDKPKMTEFHRAKNWEERSKIVFKDQRLKDFACRLLLEANHYGEASVPAETIRSAASVCAEVLSRPFADEDAPWATLKSASKEADKNWLDWAEETFGKSLAPVEPQNDNETTAPQMDFGF